MKQAIAWILISWFAVVLEHARPDLFASCSLVIPVGVGCMVWHRSSFGMIIATAVLLLRWLLSGQSFPIEVVVLLI